MQFLKKIFLGSHYAMERFIASFSVVALLMGFCVFGIYLKYSGDRAVQLETRSVYSTKMRMSKTDNTANVVGVYGNKAHTKAFLLFKFEDINKISTSADKYQMYLTAADLTGNPPNLKGSPVGGFYVFGASGYVGAYLINQDGFKPQVLDLVIRSNVELAAKTTAVDENNGKQESSDKSFDKYDQGRVYFNAGAKDIKILNALEQDKAPTIKELYDETVMKDQMADITKQLNAQLDKMRVELNQIEEYGNRLEQNGGVQLPDPPSQIAGDRIEGSLEENNLKLVTNYVVPGGFDFNWREEVDGPWVNKLISESESPGMSIDQFFAMKNDEARGDIASRGSAFTTKRTWTLKDGTKVESLDNGTNTGKYVTINNDIQRLTGAWQAYYNDKVLYQRNLLGKYLNAEATAALIDETASISVGDDALIVW